MTMLGTVLGVGNDAMEIDGEGVGEFEKVQKAVERIVREGFSAGQVLTQVIFLLTPVTLNYIDRYCMHSSCMIYLFSILLSQRALRRKSLLRSAR